MKIAAITKFKHGMLFEAMQQLNWNQARLAREAKISAVTAGRICAMKDRPSHATCRKIHKAFLKHGIFFDVMKAWPEAFKGRKEGYAITQIKDISTEQLQSHHQCLLYDTPNFGASHDYEQAIKLLEELRPYERLVVKMKYLDDALPSAICERLKISPSRVDQIEHRACEKLRWLMGDANDRAKSTYHPFRNKAA